MRAWTWVWVAVAAWPLAVRAEDDSTRQAREEIDRDLKKLVDIPPPRVELVFNGLDEPNMKLVEAEFTLDGATVKVPGLGELDSAGPHTLFTGQVSHGKHTLASKLVYTDKSSVVMSDIGGYRWKIGNEFTFPAQRGLSVRIVTTPELVPGAKEIKDRMKVTSAANAQIVARMEDGKMPPAPVANLKPILQAQANEVAAKKSEEKRQAAELAQAAKDQAKAERQAKAEAKKLARELALAEKRERSEVAKAARLARNEATKTGAGRAPEGTGPAGGTEVAVAEKHAEDSPRATAPDAGAEAPSGATGPVLAAPLTGPTGDLALDAGSPGEAVAVAEPGPPKVAGDIPLLYVLVGIAVALVLVGGAWWLHRRR